MARKARVGFRMRGHVPELGRVPRELAVAALPKIVKVAERHVRDVAPKRRGLSSKKSIVSRIKGRVDKTGEVGIVAARAPHSHLLELGVKPHSLAGKGKKKGHNLKIMGDENIIRKGAWHPGIPARPFMQKGLDQAGPDIGKVLQDQALVAFDSTMRDIRELL